MKKVWMLLLFATVLTFATGTMAFAEPNRVPDGISGSVKYFYNAEDPSSVVNPNLGFKLDLYRGDGWIKKIGVLAEGEAAIDLAQIDGEGYQGASGSAGGYLGVAPFGFPLEIGAAVLGTHDQGTGFKLEPSVDAVAWLGFRIQQ